MFGRGFAAAFSCIFQRGLWPCPFEDAFVHKCIIDDHVRLAQRVEGVQRQEARITRARAAEPDQQVLETTLGSMVADIETSGLQPPAIVCIGKSVLMRQALDWAAMAKGEAPRNTDPLGRGRPAESA